MIEFITVNAENREKACRLSVAPDQTGTVEPVAACLEEADQLSLWRPVVIAENGEWIGFAMYGLWKEEGDSGRVWLDRFFIDQKFQKRGYAARVLPVLIARIKQEYGYETLYLSVYEDNTPAIRLYEKLGFSFSGERDINGELVMMARP